MFDLDGTLSTLEGVELRQRQRDRKTRADLRAIEEAWRALPGCGDGSCRVRRPTGQHTNGGCRCLRGVRSQPETQRLVRALVDAFGANEGDGGDRG